MTELTQTLKTKRNLAEMKATLKKQRNGNNV